MIMFNAVHLRFLAAGPLRLCKDPLHGDLWHLMKYTALNCNAWFRGLYQHGVFVPAAAALKLIPFGFAIPDA